MKYRNVTLINYANEPYKKAQHFNTWTGKHVAGIGNAIEYGPEDIDAEFYRANHCILNQKRGNGEWLWKPYFILKTLGQLKDGEYVFYCDSGSFFCRDFGYILSSMGENSIWISNIPLIEKQWTKPYVFNVLEANDPSITETNQFQGGFICVRKCEKSVTFMNRWLEYCCKPEMIMPITEGEEKGECIAHREDQSILSVLSKKCGIQAHKDPTQQGRLPGVYYEKGRLFEVPVHHDNYPVCIVLHRTGNIPISVLLKQWLLAWLPLSMIYRITSIKKIN